MSRSAPAKKTSVVVSKFASGWYRDRANFGIGTLGRYVRQQRIFNPRDLIFELQFSLLKARKLQLIAMSGVRDRGDRGIEIAVLLSKLRELGA